MNTFKSFFILAFATSLVFLISCRSRDLSDKGIKILTYNIRFASFDSTQYSWPNRKEGVLKLLEGYDFIGLQEVVPVQYNEIAGRYNDVYSSVYRTREADKETGEGVPLFYSRERWELIESSTFWLSGTPDVPGSNTWGSAYCRVATMGLFCRRDGTDTLLVLNTHFDHVSQPARVQSIGLIRDRCKRYAGSYPLVLIGDFNVTDDNEVWHFIHGEMGLRDAWLEAGRQPGKGSFTFHGWGDADEGARIDYVFLSPDFLVGEVQVKRDRIQGMYPSDHFPVSAVVQLRN